MRHRKSWLSALAGVIAVLMLLAIPAEHFPAKVQASTVSELREQINALEEEEKALEEEKERLEQLASQNYEQLEQLIEQKWAIDQQIQLLHDQLELLDSQISAYSLLIADKQEEYDAAQAEYDALVEKNRLRIRVMEEEGSLSYWSVLFEANSFSDFLDRLNMIEEIAAADKRRLDEMAVVARRVAAVREEMEAQKQELEGKRLEAVQTQAEMTEKRAQADAVIRELQAKGEEYDMYIAQAEEDEEALMQQLADKEAELKEAEYQQWLSTYVPPTTKPPKPDKDPDSVVVPPSSADWVTPVKNYRLTSPFGMRTHPKTGEWSMHSGVDMACSRNTPIYATRSGKVTAASNHKTMGNYVTINHGDGFSSVYMHMEYYIVREGEYVAAGQVIGYVGDSGRTTGCHLHFGISYKGTYVNPMEYLK